MLWILTVEPRHPIVAAFCSVSFHSMRAVFEAFVLALHQCMTVSLPCYDLRPVEVALRRRSVHLCFVESVLIGRSVCLQQVTHRDAEAKRRERLREKTAQMAALIGKTGLCESEAFVSDCCCCR